MRESKNERRTRNSTVTWITSKTTMGKNRESDGRKRPAIARIRREWQTRKEKCK